MSTSFTKPAWKYPWFLFVIGLPLLVIVACFITLYLAIKSSDGVVTDDYYKEGLAINQDLRRDSKAREYGLKGRLILYENIAELHLRADANLNLAGTPLKLFLQNMGLPAQDQSLVLMPSGKLGVWRATLKQTPPKGLWKLSIESSDWRLVKNVEGLLNQPIAFE